MNPAAAWPLKTHRRGTTPPLSGSIRGGVRAQLSDRLLVEGSLGYLSIGQSGLDTVEAGLYLSYGF